MEAKRVRQEVSYLRPLTAEHGTVSVTPADATEISIGQPLCYDTRKEREGRG